MKPKNRPIEPEIARELRLAKEYWRIRIHPHIEGRILSGVELFVATNAHRSLMAARSKAEEWNKSADGKLSPVSAELLTELKGEKFHPPEPSYADEELKPEILATIAAPMMNKGTAELPPPDAVRVAHELLCAAKRYIATLPPRMQGIDSLIEELDESRYVTFAEILRSNEKNSRQLPLLPPEAPKRSNGQLKPSAIKAAVRSFLEQRTPHLTQEQWEATQAQIETNKREGKIIGIEESGRQPTYQEWLKQYDDEKKQDRISWIYLCDLRWERYKSFCDQQLTRARNRKPSDSEKPEIKKSVKANTSPITSAAKSPLTAGKRAK